MVKTPSLNKNNSPSASSWAEWFERCAQHYDDPRMKMAYYEDGNTGNPVPIEVMEAIYQDIWNKLSANKDSIILDVGGGMGMLSAAYQNRVCRFVETDISQTMIRNAKELNPQGTFFICDATSLPFASGSFDRVLSYSVFHYLNNLTLVQKVLDEFSRVVKKDGLIFIGDVLKLENDTRLPNKELEKSDKKPSTRSWWPNSLKHQLKKLTIDSSFFINYCKDKKLKCSILEQDIPGKTTTASRYDVAITFFDNGQK